MLKLHHVFRKSMRQKYRDSFLSFGTNGVFVKLAKNFASIPPLFGVIIKFRARLLKVLNKRF